MWISFLLPEEKICVFSTEFPYPIAHTYKKKKNSIYPFLWGLSFFLAPKPVFLKLFAIQWRRHLWGCENPSANIVTRTVVDVTQNKSKMVPSGTSGCGWRCSYIDPSSTFCTDSSLCSFIVAIHYHNRSFILNWHIWRKEIYK